MRFDLGLCSRLGRAGLFLGFVGAVVGCSPTGVPAPVITEVPDVVASPVVTSPPVVSDLDDETDDTEVMNPDLGRPLFDAPDIIMRCGERQMSGDIYPDRIELAIDGGDYVLLRVEAEDGDMYTDGDFALWNLEGMWGFIVSSTEEEYECFVAAMS